MQETHVSRIGLLSYEEASEELNRTATSIRNAVVKGILHPIKIPHDRFKYLDQDEVEWFKDKELSIPNAEAYRLHKAKKQQETEQFLDDYTAQAERSGSPSNALKKTVRKELEKEMLQYLAPILYIFKISMADAEKKKQLQASMLAYVQSKQIDRQGLKEFAHQLTDELLREDIEPLEEEMYQDLLAAIRTVLATSANELRIA